MEIFPVMGFADEVETAMDNGGKDVLMREGVPVFENGAPVFVGELDALRGWCERALQTPRGEHEIYSIDYGSDVHTLVGTEFDAESASVECVRMVRECFEVHEGIIEVKEVQADFEGSRLAVSCTVETTYGEVSVDV